MDTDDLFEGNAGSSAKAPKKKRKQQKSGQQQLELLLESFLPPVNAEDSRYPTLFTRIPLFEPTSDRKKADTKGWEEEDSDRYHFGNTTIMRYGPGLSVYDEDTLIAILQLAAEKSLKGSRHSINQRLLGDISTPSEGEDLRMEEVWIGHATPYRINTFLGRGDGGDQLKHCQRSMDRLDLTKLIFVNNDSGKQLSFRFFDMVRDKDAEGEVLLKINALMVKFLAEYTLTDVNLRRQLSDVGKSVYRYLSGLDTRFSVPLLELRDDIRYRSPIGDFKRALTGRNATATKPAIVGQLEILQERGFLESWVISGTGRKTPFVLHGLKTRNTNFVLEQSSALITTK